jgi:hypothetical protein
MFENIELYYRYVSGLEALLGFTVLAQIELDYSGFYVR